jgi:predicted DNA-binding transcriptional regulator AlpA
MINTKQLCALLKISDKTAYNWRKNEGLPYIQITPKKIQYDEVDVMEWVKTHNVVVSPEVDIEDIIFKQIRDSIFAQYEELSDKPVEEKLEKLIKTHNKLIKYYIDITTTNKEDFLKYLEKWNLKLEESSFESRIINKLNDKDFEGLMLNGLMRQIQELRAEQISFICGHFKLSTIDRRFKSFDIFNAEGAMDLADEFTKALGMQERFLEKIATITIKNSKNVLDELPTDDDIQELYDIANDSEKKI